MKSIKRFDFEEGRVLNNKYEVISKLGEGWEGQVYSIRELSTGIKRTAKFFFPNRNLKNKTIIGYAKKLNTLSDVPIIIKYITQEKMKFEGAEVSYLVSEFVEGQTLDQFVKKDLKNKATAFEALHILYELVKGLEYIHIRGEFHGDLHTDNVLIRRLGVGFQIKLIDLFLWNKAKREYQKSDILELINILYEILGGQKRYSQQPKFIKKIICGRRSDLILKKFPKVSTLRVYLENMNWED